MSKRINRRQFLANGAAVAGAGFLARPFSVFAGPQSPNAKLNIACIGVGGKGSSDTDACAGENIVALCDIDELTLAEKAAKFPGAKKYSDYRKMFDEMSGQIDAVTVSTPDHNHAPAAIIAMSLGKHVFVQKPLTHTVHEARLMAKLAREKKVATQMGNQGSAEEGLRNAVDLIRSGALGVVKEIHVWTNRPVWPQSPAITKRPETNDPVPPHVNWDAWLGPAPERPFGEMPKEEGKKNKRRSTYHPFNWRGWWDFGTGALGDMACHTMNLPYRAANLGTPVAVSAESEALNPETYPGWARVVYEFPKRGDLPPVNLIWYEGRKDGQLVLPPEDLIQKLAPIKKESTAGGAKTEKTQKISDSGSIVVCTKGILYSTDDYGRDWYLLPQGSATPAFERKLPKSPGHAEEWIQACKGGPAAMSNFDYAGSLTESILLGNVAMKVGKRIEYDGAKGVITNVPEANPLLTKEYRKGWELKA